jgi:hypothetical protein
VTVELYCDDCSAVTVHEPARHGYVSCSICHRTIEHVPTLADVVDTFQSRLHFPDLQPLYLNIAVELSNRMTEGDPSWLMNLGGSSRGKTELLCAFDGLPNVRVVGSLTEAALLSGTPKRERDKNAAGGLLLELPRHGATLVVKDFGAILTLPRDRRAIVVQALRDIYDGYYVRDVGTGGGQHLEWRGQLGLIAGATGSLDSHHGVISALGERWLTLRLSASAHDDDEQSPEERMARRALANSRTHELRDALTATLCGYVATLEPPAMRDLDEVDAELLVALSPVLPVSPFAPCGPVAPTSPFAPAGPAGPVSPVTPVSPLAPCGPVAPVSPFGPCGPTGPAGPAGPGGPVAPVSPLSPFGPCGPCGPCGPAGPCGPVTLQLIGSSDPTRQLPPLLLSITRRAPPFF